MSVNYFVKIFNLAWVLLACKGGRLREVNMFVTLENLEKSLKQNLAAVLWIDSSLFILDKV